jgi:hypothetical protein
MVPNSLLLYAEPAQPLLVQPPGRYPREVEEQLLKHPATHAITLLRAKRFFLVSGASRSIHGPFAHEQAVALSQR